MSDTQPTEADARELVAKLEQFNAGLPDRQKELFRRLLPDVNEVEGFTAVEFQFLALIPILIPPVPEPKPSTQTGQKPK